MAFRLDVVEDLSDLAIGSNDERGPGNSLHLLAVNIFFFDYAKLITNFLIRVGEQRVWQVVLRLKFLLRFGIIGRDAQNRGTRILQFLVRFAEPASFDGSTGSISFREEKQNHWLAAKLLQRYRVSVLIGQSKLGSFIINLHG